MSTNDGRINHQVLKVAISSEKFKERFKDALSGPSREAFINAVPITLFSGQEAPLSATTSNPQDRFEATAAFLFLPDIDVRAGSQKG
jgi:hypothetical protein